MIDVLALFGIVGIYAVLGTIVAYTASAFRPPENWPLWVGILAWPAVVVILIPIQLLGTLITTLYPEEKL